MKFIERLWDPARFEFSWYNKCYKIDEINTVDDNIFFLWEMDKPKTSGQRNTTDDSITSKKYFAIDLDIRNDFVKNLMTTELWVSENEWEENKKNYIKSYGNDISDKEIKEWATQIKDGIENHPQFKDRSYIVYTGNGIHIYYVWDYIEPISKQIYKAGVQKIYEEFNLVFENKYWDDWFIRTDDSTTNIARIFRVPWTKNIKDPKNIKEVQILYEQERHSTMPKILNKLWEKHLVELTNREKIESDLKKSERKVNKQLSKITTDDIKDLINEKDIVDTVDDCNIQHSNNRLYIGSEKTNWWRIHRRWNYVVNFNEWSDRAAGWPYSFIMNHYNYDTWDTIKRFCDRYSDVRTLVEKENIQFKQQVKQDKKEDIVKDTNENFTHISYKDKISRAYEEIKSTDPDKIIKRWWEERDNILWWIYKGKIYTIWAPSWVGKTTFVNTVVSNVAKQWWSVIRYSLEDRIEDQWKEELFDVVNRLRVKEGFKPYRWTKFTNNEYNDAPFWRYMDLAVKELWKLKIEELDKTKALNVDNLIELMEQASKWGADMFVIDHLHYFEMSWDERHDLQIQNSMQRINEVARKHNVAVFLVAHYRNTTTEWKPHTSDFKDGAAIKQVSNIIIQIVPEIEHLTKFKLTKVRGRIKWDREFICEFDLDTGEYSFEKSEKQKKLEDNFNY